LLGEIHAVLTSNIASEAGRLTGSSQPNVDSIPHLAATTVDEDGMTVPEREMWVTAAMEYCRGWDRRARPKAADGRQGWEHHLLGVLTQVSLYADILLLSAEPGFDVLSAGV